MTEFLKVEPSLANATNVLHEPVLIQAARQRNLELVKTLLDAGAAADATDWRKETALSAVLEPLLTFRSAWRTPPTSMAEQEDTGKLLRLLLERGASIFKANEYGHSPIGLAGRGRDGALVDLLLIHQHASVRDSAGNSVVHLAAVWGRTNALEALAQSKVSLENTNGAGLTPLQAVARLPRTQETPLFSSLGGPGVADDGPKLRQTTARLLVELGAAQDIFSAIALSWTNGVQQLIKQQPELARARNASGQTPLHWAAEDGEVEMLKLLLRSGSPLEAADHQGQTPLDVAAAAGHTEVVSLLVEAGASVARPPGSKTPLHWAAEQDNLALIELLLKAGADPNAEDDHHQTSLDWAARANQASALKWLLAHHAHLKTGGTNTTIPLHWAVAHANTNLMMLLLQQGSDLNARNEEGKTPLFLAHEKDNFNVLEFLLAQGANINARDTRGNTVLHLRAAAARDRFARPPGELLQLAEKALANPAVKQRVPQMLLPKRPTRSMMEFLLAHGAQANATNAAGETPLHRAAAKTFGDTNAVAEARAWIHPLARGHARLNAPDSKGRTPLHLAAQARNLAMMQALLEAGANPNQGDAEGATPLHLVVRDLEPFGQSLPVAELLLRRGARPNAVDHTGSTALHLAAAQRKGAGDPEAPILALLLKHGAKVNLRDREGRTPLHLASGPGTCPPSSVLYWYRFILPGDTEALDFYANQGSWSPEMPEDEQVAMLLLTNGAKINVPDRQGNTPLHYAAQAVRPELIEMLLARQANRSARNQEGKTPLEVAYEQPRGFVIIPLLQAPGVAGEIANAAWRGDIDLVRRFLKDDPHNVERPWIFSTTPLQWACCQGNVRLVELLLRCGAAVEPPQRDTNVTTKMIEFNALMNCLTGERERLQSASASRAQNGARKEYWENDGLQNTNVVLTESERAYLKLRPLQLSLAAGHTNIATLLISHGARVDLASAASLGLIDVLRKGIRAQPHRVNAFSRRASWLFEYHQPGFEMNTAIGEQTGTLLHFAVRGGQTRTVEYLLAAGANPAITDDEGRTPYQLAVQTGQQEIATLFKPHGADKAVPRTRSR